MKTKNQIIKNWEKLYIDSGVTPDVYKVYLQYANNLLGQQLPVIFSFTHLSQLLGRTTKYLASVINATDKHYRSFEILKKSGGKRQIDSPYPALLECQYWILSNILCKLPVHEKAFAYTKKKSIKNNAELHLKQNSFLKIDIKDFYPSIQLNKVIQLFKNLGYSHQVSFYLASICCLKNHLPQGAPTSPILSNIVFFSLDNRLEKLAEKFGLTYSRYADDIAFSGKNIKPVFLNYVKTIIESGNFRLNEEKTIIQNKPGKRILTGISIASDVLKIPYSFKRELKQAVFYIEKYGLYSHLNNIKNKNPDYLLSIEGKIIFWLFIEPNNEFARKSLAMIKSIKNTPSTKDN